MAEDWVPTACTTRACGLPPVLEEELEPPQAATTKTSNNQRIKAPHRCRSMDRVE